ncbi:hypothetical protein BDZ88DRAFT_428666 [Geranomyces variabilis]|nr:hypothetical protein BDZ88DRAFT_428666 [Geranomyces variabilis]
MLSPSTGAKLHPAFSAAFFLAASTFALPICSQSEASKYAQIKGCRSLKFMAVGRTSAEGSNARFGSYSARPATASRAL